jgi:hypothetical protein
MSPGCLVVQLVPPETTVGELPVDLGAVVVVVVVGSGAVVVDDPEEDAEDLEDEEEDPEDEAEEDDDETAVAPAVPPGISCATIPPRTAALSAAAPAATPVTRRTLRRAADLSFVPSGLDMKSSWGGDWGLVASRMNPTGRSWQATRPAL